ncbi:MAG: hypothetical protein IT189_01690 [Microbacteriaceae bacterium]|uniref:hypothetical protein n=2 Tax=Actinomycetes TaxID=1760 RepID=UPI0024B78077|nr:MULTISPECIES: hypothetical protein [unclassified Microbacterium]MBT9608289.1 hypothetical protein [Microbacterium sp.]MCC6854752.1 hypothetical protein [Microbacteriaceae bacterium]MDI9889568.1 hypothetical protein [Microbacterium sp. IEGM 1404]
MSDERLTQAMLMLDDGLRRIARRHSEDVSLLEEDPETFGAGHFVFYPAEHSRARFAIEEQYAAGRDWSDPERLPVSWLWRAERITRQADGTHVWALERHGETFPEDLAGLLVEVEKWTRKVRNQSSHADAFQRPRRDARTPPQGHVL